MTFTVRGVMLPGAACGPGGGSRRHELRGIRDAEASTPMLGTPARGEHRARTYVATVRE